MTYAVAYLLLARVILPGYEFLSAYRSRELFRWVREQHRPDLFARLERAGAALGMQPPQVHDAVKAVTRIVLHTGRDVDQLTGQDLHDHRERFYRGQRGADRGVNDAWDLLARIGVLPPGTTLRGSARRGQLSVEELVDYQQVQSRPVRDVLIRYLRERAPALDYSSLQVLAPNLAGRFWADIERHHPGLDTLRLPAEVADIWKQRLRTYTARDGTVRPRKDYLVILGQVRTFYLDIQEWAMEDPSWAAWAAPSPVRRASWPGWAKRAGRPSRRCTSGSASACRTCSGSLK